MFTTDVSGSRWRDRIARARQLADETAPAADLLEFYVALTEYQHSLLERWGGNAASVSDETCPEPRRRAPLLASLDPDFVVGAVRELVSWLPEVAPPRLREAAREMRDMTAGAWRARLDSYCSSPGGGADDFSEATIFVLEAVLQPLAERLASSQGCRVRLQADQAGPAQAGHDVPMKGAGAAGAAGGPRCPVCEGSPSVGVLREAGHGARRALVCGLCLTEWDYLRLVCAGCGEQRFESLPVFTADQFPHVRIEACDTCRRYLKTIDATRDGRAIPVVDDIATVTLDLWARDRGYTRVHANLLRL
jgi:hypothetical protein